MMRGDQFKNLLPRICVFSCHVWPYGHGQSDLMTRVLYALIHVCVVLELLYVDRIVCNYLICGYYRMSWQVRGD